MEMPRPLPGRVIAEFQQTLENLREEMILGPKTTDDQGWITRCMKLNWTRVAQRNRAISLVRRESPRDN